MTLEFTRAARNMLAIGSTISIGAFGFSLASSKWSITRVNALDYTKKLIDDPEKISSVNDIEDFEQQRGCKFLFYKKESSETVFKNGDFDFARNNKNQQINVVEQVKKFGQHCQKGSFVFITNDGATIQPASK